MFYYSTIESFPQLPATSQISALAWHTRHKSEHLSMVARIVVNSGVYLVPRPEIVLGPGGGGRLLAWKSAVAWHVQQSLFQTWNDPSKHNFKNQLVVWSLTLCLPIVPACFPVSAMFPMTSPPTGSTLPAPVKVQDHVLWHFHVRILLSATTPQRVRGYLASSPSAWHHPIWMSVLARLHTRSSMPEVVPALVLGVAFISWHEGSNSNRLTSTWYGDHSGGRIRLIKNAGNHFLLPHVQNCVIQTI